MTRNVIDALAIVVIGLLAAVLAVLVVFPRTAHVAACTEDGVTLADGACGHPDTATYSGGYWTANN